MSNVLDLDVLKIEQLQQFVNEVNAAPRKKALELFPDKPKRYMMAMYDLANYAKMRIWRIFYANRNKYQLSKRYDKECAVIYERLPDYARWK